MKKVIHNLLTIKKGMFFILLFGLISTLFFACRQEKKFNDLLLEMADLPEAERQYTVDLWVGQRVTFPVIEDSVVYFIYRNRADIPVYLSGDFNGWSPDSHPFLKVIGTDLYYNRQVFPEDARVEYKLIVGKNWQIDSLNVNVSRGGYGHNSLLFMPAYRFPLETLRQRNKVYTVPDTVTYRGGGLEYRAYIYRHSSAAAGAPLLVFNDGGDYIGYGQAAVVLDNLTAEGRIPPVNAIFIDAVDRMREYRFNAAYLERLMNEILPACEKQYQWRPEKVYMGGVSLGGLTALYALKDYAATLDGVFSQSGSFWVDSLRIIEELNGVNIKGETVFISYGHWENQDENQQKVIDFLRERKVRVKIRTFYDGHNWGNWSGALSDALYFLLSPKEEHNGI